MHESERDSHTLTGIVPAELAGVRLDKALAAMFPEHSRTSIQSWIVENRVRSGDRVIGQREPAVGGERVTIEVPESERIRWVAQDIPLDIVHEDDHLIVVNKPAGLVVHPGAGNPRNTLVNALLGHRPQLAKVARAGVVHRLDKNTSGLLVVAQTEATRLNLAKQLKKRTVKREYMAVCEGVPISGGTVDVPVGRHSRNRVQMAAGSGKPAVTHYRIIKRYRRHALLRVMLETGRTHQIRVHLKHIGYPVVGDSVYGRSPRIPPKAGQELVDCLRNFSRQALHAESLGLTHPASGEYASWHQGMPADMRELVLALKRDADAG